MKRIAINGLGRIGRIALRQYIIKPPEHVTLVAANSVIALRLNRSYARQTFAAE